MLLLAQASPLPAPGISFLPGEGSPPTFRLRLAIASALRIGDLEGVLVAFGSGDGKLDAHGQRGELGVRRAKRFPLFPGLVCAGSLLIVTLPAWASLASAVNSGASFCFPRLLSVADG